MGRTLVNDKVSTWKKQNHEFVNEYGVWKKANKEFALVGEPVVQPILWNKLGSNTEVQNSIIGPNGTYIVTPTFATTKFENGAYFGPANTQDVGAVFPLSIPANGPYAIEFWVKPNEADPAPDNSRHLFEMRKTDAGNPTGRFILSSTVTTGLNFNDQGTQTFLNLTWTAGELFHFAISRDGTTVRFYKNGALTDTVTATSTTGTIGNICLGNFNDSNSQIATSSIGWRPLNGYIDNLKIYDYAKTNFSDREIEAPQSFSIPAVYKEIHNDPNPLPILWNKLGSTTEVQNSVIGSNGTYYTGNEPTYATTKFGNGAYIGPAASQDKGIVFPFTLPLSLFSIELWLKPSTASNITSDGKAILDFRGYSSNQLIHLYFNYSTSAVLRTRGSNGSLYATNLTLSWTANELFHLAISSENGTFKVYKNGVLTDTVIRTSGQYSILNGIRAVIGNFQDEAAGLVNIATADLGGAPFAGYFDNLKIYDYAKTNFFDRQFENGLQPDPVLWNKLGSNTEVQNSVIGPDLVGRNNPLFTSCKFGNGLSATSTSSCYNTSWKSVLTNKYAFTIECWIKFSSWTITNGVSSNGLLNMLLYTTTGSIGADNGVPGYAEVSFRGTLCRFFYFDGQVAYGGSNLLTDAVIPTNFSIPLGSLVHFGFTYEFSGGVGIARMYVDGILLVSGTPVAHLDGLNFSQDGPITIGSTSSNNYNFNGNVIDNLKIYNYAKTDFNDRFFEDGQHQVPILWNKLEDNLVVRSEIGADLTCPTGATFSTGKFTGAFTAATNNPVVLPRSAFTSDPSGVASAFTIEFWIKPNYAMTNSRVVSPTFTRSLYGINVSSNSNPYVFPYFYIIPGAVNSCNTDVATYFWTGTPGVLDYVLNANNTNGCISEKVNEVNFSANTWVHIAIIYDATPDDTWNLKIYFDGILHFKAKNSSFLFDRQMDPNGFYFGNNIHGWSGSLGPIDNLKIHNYAKTDFSDREVGIYSGGSIPATLDYHSYLLNEIGTPESPITVVTADFDDTGSLDKDITTVPFGTIIGKGDEGIEITPYSYLTIPNTAGEPVGNEITVSSWIKIGNIAKLALAFDSMWANDTSGFQLMWRGNAYFDFGFSDGSYHYHAVTDGTYDMYTNTPVVGQWYHVVGTVSSTKEAKIYINGVLAGTSWDGILSPVLSPTYDIRIGCPSHSNYNSGIDAPGQFKKIRILNKELTASEVYTLYAKDIVPVYVQPIFWNKLDYPSIPSVIGQDMTLYKGVTFSPSMFNKGAYCQRSIEAAVDCLNMETIFNGLTAFTVQFWQKYTDYSVLAGDPSVDLPHVLTIGVFFSLIHRKNASLTYFTVYPDYPITSDYFQVSGMTPNIAINDIVFWGLVYDKNGVGGSTHKVRVYYYNLTSGESAIYLQNVISGSGTSKSINWEANSLLRFGRAYGNSTTWANGCKVDNLMIYDYAKTDFSDRFFENGLVRSGIRATGGTESIIYEDGVLYKIHKFTTSGTLTVTAVGSFDEIEYLVVAGGGGGGGVIGGGGGAGGFKTGTSKLTTGAKAVTVGAGGLGGFAWNSAQQRGFPGGESTLVTGTATIVSTGGGYGGAHGGADGNVIGGPGGSAGGSGNTLSVTQGIVGQGSAGGGGDGNNGGGGGGAGSVGETRMASIRGGNGGLGKQSAITGTLTWYAAGGGGGTRSGYGVGGTGGSGIGGNGSTTDVTKTSTNGVANTGSGGGGGGHDGGSQVRSGADGGSGIVIVRYVLL
jgi:hypothetical protein